MVPNPVSLRIARHRIREERRRQRFEEGMTAENDDKYTNDELMRAARAYVHQPVGDTHSGPPGYWPFGLSWWKPKSRERNLLRAGALILAEEDRIRRVRRSELLGGVHTVPDAQEPARLLAEVLCSLGLIYDRLHLVKTEDMKP